MIKKMEKIKIDRWFSFKIATQNFNYTYFCLFFETMPKSKSEV